MTFKEFKDKYQKMEVEEITFNPPKHPVVSVLVQTYQQLKFIKECLDNILMQQTNFNYEILVGDDGSTDGTREICLDYAKRYPEKIRLFLHHRENQIKVMGEATSNFNAFYNFHSARGNYIAFCEGDDVWTDHSKLQKQVNFLKENKSFILCFHDYRLVDGTSTNLDGSNFPNKPLSDISSRDLREMNLHPLLSTVCFRKIFNSLPCQIHKVLNVDTFILSTLGRHGDGKYLQGIHPSYYRIHNQGIWSKKTNVSKLLNKVNTYRQLKEYYQETGDLDISKSYSKKIKSHLKMVIYNYLKTGNIQGIIRLKHSL